MKVYVLYAYNTESYHYVMSVFSSYSAMLVWLDQTHNYKSEIDSAGYFKEQLNIDEMKFSIYYDGDAYDEGYGTGGARTGVKVMPARFYETMDWAKQQGFISDPFGLSGDVNGTDFEVKPEFRGRVTIVPNPNKKTLIIRL